MKKADLKRGVNYLINGSSDWVARGYGNQCGTVLDLQGGWTNPSGWRAKANEVRLEDGSVIECYAYRSASYGSPSSILMMVNGSAVPVMLGNIRGEWETCIEQVNSYSEARRNQQAAANVEYGRKKASQFELANQLRALGVDVSEGYRSDFLHLGEEAAKALVAQLSNR